MYTNITTSLPLEVGRRGRPSEGFSVLNLSYQMYLSHFLFRSNLYFSESGDDNLYTIRLFVAIEVGVGTDLFEIFQFTVILMFLKFVLYRFSEEG